MNSTKDIFEPHIFGARMFAAGIFRGRAVGGKICGHVYIEPALSGNISMTPRITGDMHISSLITGSVEMECSGCCDG